MLTGNSSCSVGFSGRGSPLPVNETSYAVTLMDPVSEGGRECLFPARVIAKEGHPPVSKSQNVRDWEVTLPETKRKTVVWDPVPWHVTVSPSVPAGRRRYC